MEIFHTFKSVELFLRTLLFYLFSLILFYNNFLRRAVALADNVDAFLGLFR